MPDPQRPGDDPEAIADAAFLFDDTEHQQTPAQSIPGLNPEPVVEGYDIEGGDFETSPPTPEPVRPPILIPAKKKPREEASVSVRQDRDDREESVDVVWSRWGEWGPTLSVLSAIGLGLLVVLYLFGSILGFYSLLVVFLTGVVMVLLAYPIAVTLERPTRMTPEQAVKDYYEALSHHFPAYRRMWFLLSDRGKSAPEFGSFPEFRSAMTLRMKELRGSEIKPMTPLSFKVETFKSEKSGGLKKIDASYKLRVLARGSDETIATYAIKTTLVRGPDNMWYLNSGEIPRTQA